MNRTCKQCGKPFVLTDSEIEFFESKGLELPKRCEDCRKKNREAKGKTGGTAKADEQNATRTSSEAARTTKPSVASSKPANGKSLSSKVIGGVAAVVVAVAVGVFGIGGDAPRLVCGVASDVHVDCDEHEAAFRRTLEWFRSVRVDAVVIAGDLTTGSRIPEFERMAGVWRSVFPRDALPDGSRVERLFVTGNHDTDVLQKFATRAQAEEQSFTFRRAETWARLFGEPYESVFRKDVRGVPFLCRLHPLKSASPS